MRAFCIESNLCLPNRNAIARLEVSCPLDRCAVDPYRPCLCEGRERVSITALFEQLYADGVDHGLSDLDHAGLFVELASRNGME